MYVYFYIKISLNFRTELVTELDLSNMINVLFFLYVIPVLIGKYNI